jgi:hypothetical protein
VNEKEAVQMMYRCLHEVEGLRAVVSRLQPKAEAYDAVVKILGLLPDRAGGVMSEDIVWVLKKRIRELQEEPAEEGRPRGPEHDRPAPGNPASGP